MRGRFGLQIGLGLMCGASLFLAQTPGPRADNLPPPGIATPNFSQMIPKPANVELRVPPGFSVSLYAEDLPGVRWMQWSPNGDLFVSQSNRNRITVLRDTNGDGKPDLRKVFAENPTGMRRGPDPRRGPNGTPQNFAPPLPSGPLRPGDPAAAAVPCTPPTGPTLVPRDQRRDARIQNPMGIAFRPGRPGYIYIANTDSIIRWNYTPGDLEAQGEPRKIVDLPGGGLNAWRNVIFNGSVTKMYVTVGSATNNRAGEDCRRATILEFNPDGTGYRIFASGLRNPEGLAWEPGTNKLWTSVNERDYLGDDLVPDFITSVKDGGFYGWPYSYIGPNYDPRYTGGQADLVKRTVVPDFLLQAHSAPLGLIFYTGNQFPQRYRNGAFVAMHGSSNRSKAAGYKVVFVRFRNGVPERAEDFLTGFVVSEGGRNADGTLAPITQWGRPVGLTIAGDGSLLVSDDQGGRIWQIRYTTPPRPR
jgi:glucose/arabinose dehydrogenase